MWGYMVFYSVLLSCIFTPSLQSPQNSFFKWPNGEVKGDLITEQQARTSVKEKLGPELMPSKPINLSNSEERDTTKLPNIWPLRGNLTSGLISYIGEDIRSFLATSVVFLGALLGREECNLKAACLVGTIVPPLQGRDIAVIAAESIVPAAWKNFYEAAKSSIIQGQDCSQFDCV